MCYDAVRLHRVAVHLQGAKGAVPGPQDDAGRPHVPVDELPAHPSYMKGLEVGGKRPAGGGEMSTDDAATVVDRRGGLWTHQLRLVLVQIHAPAMPTAGERRGDVADAVSSGGLSGEIEFDSSLVEFVQDLVLAVLGLSQHLDR